MASNKRTELHDKWRENIRTAKVLDRLIDSFSGNLELTDQQVKIGLALLKKTLPDLTSSESDINVTGEIDTNVTVKFVNANRPA
jgi:hypothetical protein